MRDEFETLLHCRKLHMVFQIPNRSIRGMKGSQSSSTFCLMPRRESAWFNRLAHRKENSMRYPEDWGVISWKCSCDRREGAWASKGFGTYHFCRIHEPPIMFKHENTEFSSIVLQWTNIILYCHWIVYISWVDFRIRQRQLCLSNKVMNVLVCGMSQSFLARKACWNLSMSPRRDQSSQFSSSSIRSMLPYSLTIPDLQQYWYQREATQLWVHSDSCWLFPMQVMQTIGKTLCHSSGRPCILAQYFLNTKHVACPPSPILMLMAALSPSSFTLFLGK